MISPQNARIVDKSPFLLITPGGQHLYIKGKLTARNFIYLRMSLTGFIAGCRSCLLILHAQ